MSANKLMTALLAVALVAIAVWQWRELQTRDRINRETHETALQTLKANMVGNLQVQMSGVGDTLTWPELEVLNQSPSGKAAAGPAHYRVVLYFDELGCDVCRDQETRFLEELATTYGTQHTAIVLKASNTRYLANYVRLNQIKQPILFDKQGRFAKENNIRQSPLLLLLDEHDRILTSFAPNSQYPELSQIFHERCWQLLANPS